MEELLFGVSHADAQSVGNMEVIPLIQEMERTSAIPEGEYGIPDNVRIGTSDYGSVDMDNDDDRTVIVPPGAGWVVEQAAQDHAIGSGKILKPKERSVVNTARCIQRTQPGNIRNGSHDMLILPAELRGPALALKNEVSYNALWKVIAGMQRSHGVDSSSNLVDFLRTFKAQMDAFVAEFELLDDQVGAIVLINGNIVGVEVAPSREYWKSVWTPLVRVCYGSLASACYKGMQDSERLVPMSNRMPLEMEGDTLNDLGEALMKSQTEYVAASKAVFDDMRSSNMLVGAQDQKSGKNSLLTVGVQGDKEKSWSRMSGQMVLRDDGRIPFFSACIS
jgi:hypothetical protein